MRYRDTFFHRHGVEVPVDSITLNLALEKFIEYVEAEYRRKPSKSEIKLLAQFFADKPGWLARAVEYTKARGYRYVRMDPEDEMKFQGVEPIRITKRLVTQ